jgi:apolipoprotein N-acyltransferase
VPWTEPSETVTVAAVQVDPVCPGRYSVDCPGEREELLVRHLDATTALAEPIDLLLWGEGSLSGPPEAVGRDLVDEAGTLPAPLLAGVTTSLDDNRFANRNLLYDQHGELLGSYDKRQPVPFGEYVPARRWLGGIGDVGRYVPADMARGTAPGELALPFATLGTVSSWEVTFSRLVRDTGRLGEAVVVLTTQSTYQRAPVSDQLLRTAQLRAVELQRPVLVAATTGRSALIDATGQRVTETRLYGADLLVTEIGLTSGETPFARWGDLLAVAVAGIMLAALAVHRSPRSIHPGALSG